MMRLLAIFSIVFFVAMSAKAANIVLTYDTPTEREDGSALPIEQIDGYKLYRSHNGAAPEITNIPADQNSYIFSDVETGVYTFEISTVDSDLIEGAKSESITVPVLAGPSAPAFTRIIKETCDAMGNCEQEIILEVSQ